MWRSPVFPKKGPTQRAILVADNKLIFACLKGQHPFRICPKVCKCLKQDCSSTHNTLLHGSEESFPKKCRKQFKKTDETRETTKSSVTVVTNKTEKSPGMPSVTKVKGFFQITEFNLPSTYGTQKVLVLCDSACNNSRIFENLAGKYTVQGTPSKFTVNGINSNQTIDTHFVELKLKPVHSVGSCLSFVAKLYVREILNVETNLFDVKSLQVQCPHLEPTLSKKYSYGII